MQNTEVAAVPDVMPRTQVSTPHVSDLVADALASAIERCRQRLGLESQEGVIDRLRSGDFGACDYFRHDLACGVGACLGMLDRAIQEVHLFSYSTTPDDAYLDEANLSSPLHLIVKVERKTAALSSVIKAVDEALVQHYAALVGRPALTRVLDAQVVDGTEVEKRIGYGALFSSVYNRPLLVWER